MHYAELVFKGILIGIGVSAPIGPIGILCINRSIKKGTLSGIYTGLGATIPNVIYSILALYGLTEFLKPFVEKHFWVPVISGIYILWLGFQTIMKESDFTIQQAKENLRKDFFSTFLIMISNPATILSFILLITAVGISTDTSLGSHLLLTVGVFAGAMSWWIGLSFFSTKIGYTFFLDKTKLLNKISGTTIFLFGIFLIIKSIKLI